MRVVTEPLLDLSDVGLVIKRVGGGGRAQRMRADQKSQLPRITPHQSIDAMAGAVVADGPEQRAAVVEAVTGGVEIVVDQSMSAGTQRTAKRKGHSEFAHLA